MTVVMLAIGGCAAGESNAAAQTTTPLARVIPTLLGDGLKVAPGRGGTHQLDFVPIPGEFPYSRWAPELDLNVAILEQVVTFPTGSSSGGFLYNFNPAVGTFTRTTRSFGSSYGERPLTSGKHTVSAGFSLQSVTFNQYDGMDLEGGTLRYYVPYRDRARLSPPPLTPESGDVMEATLRVETSTRTFLSTVTYGVTDRLDIGLTVPIVDTTLKMTVDKRILRLGTAADPMIHSFDGLGSSTATSSGGGTASGLGDVRVHVKYNLVRRTAVAFAGAAEIRLPTGDAANLLGTGSYFTRFYTILAAGSRTFSPHLTVGSQVEGGTTFSGNRTGLEELIGGGAERAVIYTAGFDWSAHERATFSADLLGRFASRSIQSTAMQDVTLPFVTSPGGPAQSLVVQGALPVVGDLYTNMMQGVIGTKVAAWRTMLVAANVLFPVTRVGLTNKPALHLGVEYTF